jgi:hypothetical protein
MDCKTARILMDFAHAPKAELEGDERNAFEAHVLECADCASLAYVERKLDEHLGRAMRALSVPPDLRDRLQARLKKARGALHRRQSIGLAAAAALLVVTTLGAWYWLNYNRPTVSAEERARELEQFAGMTVEQLEAWCYHNFGAKTVLPRNVNYAYLSDCYQAKLQGRLVPRLRFVREQSVADMIVLSASQFDLEALKSPLRAGSGPLTVVPHSDPNIRDTAYLIEFTGPSINWLLKEPPDAL